VAAAPGWLCFVLKTRSLPSERCDASRNFFPTSSVARSLIVNRRALHVLEESLDRPQAGQHPPVPLLVLKSCFNPVDDGLLGNIKALRYGSLIVVAVLIILVLVLVLVILVFLDIENLAVC